MSDDKTKPVTAARPRTRVLAAGFHSKAINPSGCLNFSAMSHLYDRIGQGYRAQRRPDPRIAGQILQALGGARRVANIGTGTGSYEPRDREVAAVEPSMTMIRQRPASRRLAVQALAVSGCKL